MTVRNKAEQHKGNLLRRNKRIAPKQNGDGIDSEQTLVLDKWNCDQC